jgi:hypothetical protein
MFRTLRNKILKMSRIHGPIWGFESETRAETGDCLTILGKDFVKHVTLDLCPSKRGIELPWKSVRSRIVTPSTACEKIPVLNFGSVHR